MKRKIVILSVILIFSTLFIGCSKTHKEEFNEFENNIFGNGAVPDEIPNNVNDLGNDDTSFGTSIEDLGAYKGYFEEEIADVTVTCISGTQDSHKLEGNTLTFGAVSEDSVYSLSGKLKGNIVIDIGDEHKFELELQGFSLVSENGEPIKILSGNEVSLKAKNGYENYVYDMRRVLDENETEQVAGAVYSEVDLEISGKGKLYVVSENNNGIRSKDDLQVKNLELTVICVDNALKGNDSVEIVGGKHTLIASAGDGIKTSKSDVSEKGNQRGNVSICEGAVVDIYSACDGIDKRINKICKQ